MDKKERVQTDLKTSNILEAWQYLLQIVPVQ